MSERRNLYQTVTDKIVSAIEAGAGDWQMPWIGFKAGLPFNATTDAEYHGVNVLMLCQRRPAQGEGVPRLAVRRGRPRRLIPYGQSPTGACNTSAMVRR